MCYKCVISGYKYIICGISVLYVVIGDYMYVISGYKCVIRVL